MHFSRLRLRLAGSFALAFLAGLTVLNAALFFFLRHQVDQRLTGHVRGLAADVVDAVQREYADVPLRPFAHAATSALEEWPPGPEGIVVYDAGGSPVAQRGDTALTRLAPTQIAWSAPTTIRDLRLGRSTEVRLITTGVAGAPQFAVAVLLSTAPAHVELAELAWWLAISSPIVLFLSLAGGYLLARRALAPIGTLADTMGHIAPDALDQRVPVNQPADEVDRLAEQFNGLLARLQAAQARNRRFLRQAAHQIKTPLTLVLGEADLSLDRPREGEAHRQALKRVRIAAEQMRRRVDDLLLLAHAEAGDRPPLNEVVELDGLALECADLMRARARMLERQLELARVEGIAVRGSEDLLREALLELIENAARHGSNEAPIRISAYSMNNSAVLEVASSGSPGPVPPPKPSPADEPAEGRGLGLAIVSWIALEHGGELNHRHEGGLNRYFLVLPLLSSGSPPPALATAPDTTSTSARPSTASVGLIPK
jgi:signal transduction histidine kinase